jgi:hypothetical protein
MSTAWSERQRRFLAAYQQRPAVAPAARMAGLHRSTVYRWLADPAFQAVIADAFAAWDKGHLQRYEKEEAERRRQRELRELELRPMRLANLEKARAARRRHGHCANLGGWPTW